jgi:hypothetical protein
MRKLNYSVASPIMIVFLLMIAFVMQCQAQSGGNGECCSDSDFSSCSGCVLVSNYSVNIGSRHIPACIGVLNPQAPLNTYNCTESNHECFSGSAIDYVDQMCMTPNGTSTNVSMSAPECDLIASACYAD